MNNKLKAFIKLTRPMTATSTILTALGGTFYAINPIEYPEAHIPLIVLVGVTLAHLSVNALNDYFDYKSGLDFRTPRTPFSGGSKVLVDGILSPIEALVTALTLLLLAFAIGLYLTLYRGPLILALAVAGALIIVTYNRLLVRFYLGEIAVWVKGVLVFIGAHYTITGFITMEAVVVGLIYGGVSALILYTNFIPDMEADKAVGRRTLPILLGDKVWIGYVLLALTLAAILLLTVAFKLLNPIALLALIPLALTPRVAFKLKARTSFEDLVEALALNARLCRGIDVVVTAAIVVNAFL